MEEKWTRRWHQAKAEAEVFERQIDLDVFQCWGTRFSLPQKYRRIIKTFQVYPVILNKGVIHNKCDIEI